MNPIHEIFMENVNKFQINDAKTMNKENLYSKDELSRHFRLHSELKKRAYKIAPLCTNISSREEITGIWMDDGEYDLDEPMVGIGVWSQDCGNDAYWFPLEYFSMTTDEIEKSEKRKAELERKRLMEEEKREAARKKMEKERRERSEYERLRKKFG